MDMLARAFKSFFAWTWFNSLSSHLVPEELLRKGREWSLGTPNLRCHHFFFVFHCFPFKLMTSKWIIKQIVNGKSVESSTEQVKFHFNLIIIMWTIKQAEETFRNWIPWKFNFYWVINSAELPDDLFPPLPVAISIQCWLNLRQPKKGFLLCFGAWVDQDDLHNDKRRLIFWSGKNLNVTDSWVLFYNRRSMFLQLCWTLHNLCQNASSGCLTASRTATQLLVDNCFISDFIVDVKF